MPRNAWRGGGTGWRRRSLPGAGALHAPRRSLPPPAELPGPQLHLVDVDEEHDGAAQEDCHAREIVAGPGGGSCRVAAFLL